MTKAKRLLSIALACLVIVIAWVWANWWSWSHGITLASANGVAGQRYVIREIPHTTSLIYFFVDASGYSYRMEYWEWPHFIRDCRTYTGASYRAKTARIQVAPEGCVFYLDDKPVMAFSGRHEWQDK